MTIQEFMRKFYRDQFYSGKWGCHIIGKVNKRIVREERLRTEFPHGFKVQLNSFAYWVWLNHD